MAKSKTSKANDVGKMRFEQAAEELEAIIEQIEQGEVELEDSLAAYQRGLALVKHCRSILDTAEEQVKELTVEEIEDSSEGDS